VLIVTDGPGAIVESSETNNVGKRSLTISP
jgi:hypothetical protein